MKLKVSIFPAALSTFFAYSATLFVLLIVIYLGYMLQKWDRELAESNPLIIILKENIPDYDKNVLFTKLKRDSLIHQIDSIPASQGLRLLQQRITADVENILGYNPIPQTFILSYKADVDSIRISKHIAKLKLNDIIDEVGFQPDDMESFRPIIQRIYSVGIIFSAIFTLMSFIFLNFFIRLSMYIHRDEIHQLQKEHSSKFKILMPFILQILVMASLSYLLAFGLLWFLQTNYLNIPSLGLDFSLLPILYTPIILLFLVNIFISTGLTWIIANKFFKTNPKNLL